MKKVLIGFSILVGFVLSFFITFEVQSLSVFVLVMVFGVLYKIYKDYKGAAGIFIIIGMLFLSIVGGLLLGDVFNYISTIN